MVLMLLRPPLFRNEGEVGKALLLLGVGPQPNGGSMRARKDLEGNVHRRIFSEITDSTHPVR